MPAAMSTGAWAKTAIVAMLEHDVEPVHRSRQHAGFAGQAAHPTCCCPAPWRCRDHVDQWLAANGNKPFEMRNYIRDLNAFTSQDVFAGPYLDDPAVRRKGQGGAGAREQ